MITIQSIFIYPIKGMGGIQLEAATLASEGFENDRRWMLVDAHGTFLSQRSHPQMALFDISISDGTMHITFKEVSHSFPIETLSNHSIPVTVFDHQMLANEVSEETSAWFSTQLNTEVKLMRQSKVTRRIKQFGQYIRPDDQNRVGSNTLVSFADGYPYLILGTASLDYLNEKIAETNNGLKAPLSMDRFRPNIVVNTTIPHEEDNWGIINIGDQQLFVVKPCARCQVTTVDQQKGEVAGKEPLVTLNKYRKVGNKVNFGANGISLTSGLLKVGDVVEV